MAAVDWFLWFVLYGFIGWIYESTLCSVMEKKLVNRGFLNGPVCPIYGTGAVLVTAVFFGRTENLFILFFGSILLTCGAEYLTSVLLEKLFDARWWDYSSQRFNIAGRVSLLGALAFGSLSVLLVLFLHPLVYDFTMLIPPPLRLVASAVIFGLLLTDVFFTVRHILMLNGRLREMQEALNGFLAQSARRAEEMKTGLMEAFEASEFYSEKIKKLFSLRRFQDLRLARAFPDLISKKYDDAWQQLKKLQNSAKKIRDRLR